ncbi:hypothetical protein HD597_003133 [Nonomuraea thailandensis]|uniref:Lipoprotein n=1 Tax=Nonomuraea thailandensis TaxID=1188745 RepID=A0A9X2GKX5_9ACTN|nr:hypothetical protein [Nonomuraea thailandensis]MCP2356113.1 hypothetical protein [Nonomuraea thailandensis]
MKMTWPAVATVFAAAALLTGGCADGQGGAGQAGPAAPGQTQPGPTITADDELPTEGSGDLPEATAQVGLDCKRMLKEGDFAGTAQKMGQVASGGGTDGEKAVAKVCKAAAEANQRQWRQASGTVREAEQQAEDIPAPMRPAMLRMLNESKLTAALALGDAGSAKEAWADLGELGGIPKEFLGDACSLASDPATLPECATVTSPPTTTESSPDGGSPSGEESPTNDEHSSEEPVEPTEPEPGPTDTGDPAETSGEDGSTPQEDDGPAPAES